MYNAPPPNLMHGIHLVQAGRKADALPYLRRAAQTETLTAEGWLWLAAATDDLAEYRYCVERALQLDASHPVALRMRDALAAQGGWNHTPPPAPAHPAYGPQSQFATSPRPAPAPRRRAWGWRILRALVVALLLGGCIGISASLIWSGAITELVRDWMAIETLHTLDFAIGDEPDYHFRVDVLDTWRPANTDNAAWRATRAGLEERFPESGALWDTLGASFSTVVRDPTYGTIMPPVHIVETDPDRLAAAGMVPALTLYEIVPLPDPPPGSGDAQDVCTRMRALETQLTASGTYALAPGGTVRDTTHEERTGRDDCVVSVERRYRDLQPEQVPVVLAPDAAPDAMREVVIAVPVGTVRYAVWQITYPDHMHDDYEYMVTRVRESLRYLR